MIMQMGEQKTAVITGATGGIGKVVCKYLIDNGYKILAACRSHEKGELMRNELCNSSNSDNLVFIPLNLKSFASVKKFCSSVIESINETDGKINLLINNAGMIAPVYEVTEDGYESSMQVNYLSAKLITETLLPHIRGKIINTVSCTITSGSMQKIVKEPVAYNKKESSIKSLKFYSNSKLMLALYTIQLHRTLIDNKDIQVYGIDPGIVNTGIITMHRWYDFLADIFFRPFIKTPEQGALPVIMAIEYSTNAATHSKDNKGPLLFIGKKIKSFPKKILKIDFLQ